MLSAAFPEALRRKLLPISHSLIVRRKNPDPGTPFSAGPIGAGDCARSKPVGLVEARKSKSSEEQYGTHASARGGARPQSCLMLHRTRQQLTAGEHM
jgi:hypothetical protein